VCPEAHQDREKRRCLDVAGAHLGMRKEIGPAYGSKETVDSGQYPEWPGTDPAKGVDTFDLVFSRLRHNDAE